MRNSKFKSAMAKYFSVDNEDCSLVLMRGHGMSVVGSSTRESTVRAIYVQQNAKLQSVALNLSATLFRK